MTTRFTRRQFLKLSGAALLSAFLPAPDSYRPFRPRPQIGEPVRMGRAIHAVTRYDAPRSSAERLGAWSRDETFVINREVRAPGLNAHNDLWYETPDGYVFSAWVQPMWVWPPQLPIVDVGEWGFWGEVCVPFTDALHEPAAGASRAYRFYNGTTYRVVAVTFDDAGAAWYKVYDELPPPTYQWVRATDLRRIPRGELTPIHPFAGAKRIEIDLTRQWVGCFEGDRLVFTTPCAAGLGSRTLEDGTVQSLATPEGDHCVLLKQVSRHMSNRPQDPEEAATTDFFDLPGVPWVVFFDLKGTAFHGAYWHNDYGIPRSHGCVNVPIDAARWIYLWTYPIGGAEDDFVQGTCRVGTPVRVFRS